ncbi:unnamed protein product [Soboliphyme baturini]|uniref:AH domain-containing protein n=1 Tax=Soboliphyme baturini TaxID=241478 RepID=A0A183J316_9BILA|nr:unnamed protein product [Soboliphyme baturini]
MCKTLMQHIGCLLKSHVGLVQTYREFGDIFVEIGNHEPQISSGEVFLKFGDAHRNMEKHGIQLVKVLQPMLGDLHTFLYKAVPDTRLTVKKYLDAKFEYLSYCLKIKEMDDEEAQCSAMQEALYRVETGNYEYRLILRCRQEARKRFSKLRSDVLVKLELLDQKRVRDIAYQLQLFVNAIAKFHVACKNVLQPTRNLFPIEVDISQVGYKYNTTGQLMADGEEDGDQDEGDEATNELLNLNDDVLPLSLNAVTVADDGDDKLLDL